MTDELTNRYGEELIEVRIPKRLFNYLVNRRILSTFDPEDDDPLEEPESPQEAVDWAIMDLIIGTGDEDWDFKDIRESWVMDYGMTRDGADNLVKALLHEDHGA